MATACVAGAGEPGGLMLGPGHQPERGLAGETRRRPPSRPRGRRTAWHQRLLTSALATFSASATPCRVLIHKSSRFTGEEPDGFTAVGG